MSRESLGDLNTNVLIGNTYQRGTAWHYRAALQDGEAQTLPPRVRSVTHAGTHSAIIGH